eukprot:scaffold14836_cov134-Cylindrotheca_fusiformis.AAC.4
MKCHIQNYFAVVNPVLMFSVCYACSCCGDAEQTVGTSGFPFPEWENELPEYQMEASGGRIQDPMMRKIVEK